MSDFDTLFNNFKRGQGIWLEKLCFKQLSHPLYGGNVNLFRGVKTFSYLSDWALLPNLWTAL